MEADQTHNSGSLVGAMRAWTRQVGLKKMAELKHGTKPVWWQTCIPHTRKAEVGSSRIQGQPRTHSERVSKTKTNRPGDGWENAHVGWGQCRFLPWTTTGNGRATFIIQAKLWDRCEKECSTLKNKCPPVSGTWILGSQLVVLFGEV